MAKQKSKDTKGLHSKHLRARISFLQQASTYLVEQSASAPRQKTVKEEPGLGTSHESSEASCPGESQILLADASPIPSVSTQVMYGNDEVTAATTAGSTDPTAMNDVLAGGLPFYLISHLRQVALRSQIRLTPAVKHASCRTCHAVLIEGRRSRKFVENLSRGGKKPHADVLVVECLACGTKKRFPTGAKRQTRKAERQAATKAVERGANEIVAAEG